MICPAMPIDWWPDEIDISMSHTTADGEKNQVWLQISSEQAIAV